MNEKDLRDLIKSQLIEIVEEKINDKRRDLWYGRVNVSFDAIHKYLNAISNGFTIYVGKNDSYTKVKKNLFTSNKNNKLSLDDVAKLIKNAYDKKDKVQIDKFFHEK